MYRYHPSSFLLSSEGRTTLILPPRICISISENSKSQTLSNSPDPMNILAGTDVNTTPLLPEEKLGISRAMGLAVAAVMALSYPVTSESQTDRLPISKEAQLHTDILDFSGVLDKKSNQRFAHIFGKENLSVDGPSIRVSHPKDSYGPTSGSGFLYEIPAPLERATLLYEVMFKGGQTNGGIDFGRGGKLPGFS